MKKNAKIYVAGHSGLVGSAILRKLRSEGFENIAAKSRGELDLTDQEKTKAFFQTEKPEFVFLAAAKVGGIMANDTYPAEFIYQNLQIESNVIHNSYLSGVKKLLFLGSSCIYPKFAQQPIKEEYLLSGKLEPTNEPYAIAKITGIKMCQSYNRQYGTNFISAMPTNLYGPNDNFDLQTAHVLPAMIRKFYEAKISNQPTVVNWGTGKAKREFLHVDDLADACLFLMENYNDPEIINIGTGEEVTIKELSDLAYKATGYNGNVIWDDSKPDGTPRKLLDVSRLHALGWRHKIELVQGINNTLEWYKNTN